jgi:anthranilate synthase component 2
VASPRILVVDNFDSFTFTLVDYLRAIGAQVTVARNDAVTADAAAMPDFDALLISPGPGRPEDAGISVPLAAACIARRKPLLGVCLGHQAIAVACGARVARVPPVHGKVMAVTHDSTGLFTGLPAPFQATRYHSLAADPLDPPLVANAWSDDGVIMGLRHESAPVHGVQFHPESIASQHGHQVLKNFLKLAGALS